MTWITYFIIDSTDAGTDFSDLNAIFDRLIIFLESLKNRRQNMLVRLIWPIKVKKLLLTGIHDIK